MTTGHGSCISIKTPETVVQIDNDTNIQIRTRAMASISAPVGDAEAVDMVFKVVGQ